MHVYKENMVVLQIKARMWGDHKYWQKFIALSVVLPTLYTVTPCVSIHGHRSVSVLLM